MNTVELHHAIRLKPNWAKFADKLKNAMADYPLDGVTVVLREMSSEEMADEEADLLTFDQENQRFEFAIAPGGNFPAAWKVADRIDAFLNPDEDAALS